MNSNVKVTGCIVTYNNSDIIVGCIESLFRETRGVDFTLYVVDNHSADGTAALIREHFPNLTVLEQKKNGGFGHGHNQVLPLLNSKYHAVINPDIYVEGDVIAGLVSMLEERPEVVIATPKILNEDGTEQFLPKMGPSIRHVIVSKFKPFRYLREEYTRQNEEDGKEMEIEMSTGCFFVVRTEIYKQLKGFDTRYFLYCEDADLSKRARAYGKIIFWPYVSATHKWSRANTRSLKGIVHFLTSMFKYFLRWGVSW